MKKFLALLLTVTMAMSCVSVNTFADATDGYKTYPEENLERLGGLAYKVSGDWKATVFGDSGGKNKVVGYSISDGAVTETTGAANTSGEVVPYYVVAEREDGTVNIRMGINDAANSDSNSNVGKISRTSDGFTYYYQELDANDSFVISATGTVNALDNTNNQVAFGAMVRDYVIQLTPQEIALENVYVDGDAAASQQNYDAIPYESAMATNYVAAGPLRMKQLGAANPYIFGFYRLDGTLYNYTSVDEKLFSAAEKVPQAGDVYDVRLVKSDDYYYIQFGNEGALIDNVPLGNDEGKIYAGLFSSRNADISWADVKLEKTNATAMKITSNPVLEYAVGEEFDALGLEAVATMADGSEVTLTYNDLIITDVDTSTEGFKNVSVSYGGQTITLEVKVGNVEKQFMYGDANNDGMLTAGDAAMVLQKVLNSTYILDITHKYADVDVSGNIDAADAAMILQKVLKSTYLFPAEELAEETTEATTEVTESTTVDYGVEIPDFPTDFSSEKTVSTYSELKNAISALNGTQNAVIYITDDIDCTASIKLTTQNANLSFVGVQKADGTYPVIDFASFRDNASGSGESYTGIHISGSYYNFKNLFIQNAPDCGMRIKGSSAGNCIIENCVFRYNNNSGISITSGGKNNTIKSCDSYRNCDLVQKQGSDADGFSLKLSAGGGNIFYNCRAWENGDDGWDSYDHYEAVTYLECMCWHNGDADIFTGKYDYENNLPLDKNLIYVQALMENDADFENKYNNRSLDTWPSVTLKLLGSSVKGSNINNSNWGGNPNGFKFGSANVGSSAKRYVVNCLAFGHGGKGFDQNNASCTVDMLNTVGYDNGSQNSKNNYMMGNMTATRFENCVSFNSATEDQLPSGSGIKVATVEPSQEIQTEIRARVDATFNQIKEDLNNNIIPGEVLFDIYNLTK